MNYIYDVALNFQENYYQFFEWNRHDKIKNIPKIPIYHIGDEDLLSMKNNKIKVNSTLINKIKEGNKKQQKIICLVSNQKITLGLLFSEEGFLLKRSSLIYEEEDEANNLASNLPLTKITYQENIPLNHENKLRIEIEKKEILLNYINHLKDPLLIKYLYYEYFRKECPSLKKMKSTILEAISENWTKKQNDLYHLVKLISKNNLSSKERTNSS